MAQKLDYQIAPTEAIEAHLGEQLTQIRLSKNINQAQLAEDAGVSRRTITRLERGDTVSLDTLIRVLRALGLASRLATLLPDPKVRPIDRVRLKGKKERKRARRTAAPATAEWRWSDRPDDPA